MHETLQPSEKKMDPFDRGNDPSQELLPGHFGPLYKISVRSCYQCWTIVFMGEERLFDASEWGIQGVQGDSFCHVALAFILQVMPPNPITIS